MSILSAAVHAELAEASYADFEDARRPDGSFDFDDLKAALERIGHEENEPKDPNTGFSSSQADAFLQRWEVIHHQPDTESGFSATLFKSKDPNAAQPYVLAIRGTAGFQYLVVTDGSDIVLDGLAIDQIKGLVHVVGHFPYGRVVEAHALERVA